MSFQFMKQLFFFLVEISHYEIICKFNPFETGNTLFKPDKYITIHIVTNKHFFKNLRENLEEIFLVIGKNNTLFISDIGI